MNLSKIFNYQNQQVRTIVMNDEPWFVLIDLVKILDLSNSRMVKDRLDDDVSSTYPIPDSIGRLQETTIVNEDGLYDVILESRKPEARAFRKWITSEVLPSIRKHGTYMTPETIEKTLTNPDFIIQLATNLKQEQAARQKLQAQIEENRPKLALYETAMNAGNNMTMEKVAKILDYGRNKLFAFLRQEKILRHNNMPYQQYLDRGYFGVRTYSITHLTTGIENKTQTLVTPKGLEYIHNLLVSRGIIEDKGALV